MLLSLACCLGLVGSPVQEPKPELLTVAFLGDRGHHVPWERCQAALAPLRARGIDLRYTEDLSVMQRLDDYDALVVYANLGQLGEDNERALVDWVQGGGALVPVHCASFCFHDSEEYIRMVGAQFLRHGGEVFTTTRSEHPINDGLAGLEAWDETYVHHRHNPDRTVIATRDDAEGSEPWTWVREEGEGRVFYTAWGHDLRVWSQPAFHDLLARGIRWASGDDTPGEFVNLAPLPESETTAPIPNYQPGQRGQQFQMMQGPLEPEVALERMVVDPRFELQLFASEPDIGNVIAMAWDERGRLFVAETLDYPNERKDEGGRDRIRILEDTDGDGKADKFTTFAEGLSIPTSLCVTGAGVVVLQAPDTLLFTDHDGDDVADERKVLFRGWGTGDTHAGPSHLRYGFDGWLWGTVGYSGFRGKVGEREHAFGQAIYRFRPDGSELEVIAPTSNNTWGLGFSEEGLVFGSTANGNPSVQMAIPNRFYEALPGFSPGALPTIAERIDIHPITAKVRQVDYHGKFTAAAAHTLYTARSFPPEYWNSAAFVCAPTGHLLHQFFLEEEGSRFIARDGWNLVASDDEWMSPVAVEVGPDGAVWFSDWYSFIVQPNPTPAGFENGRGNAYVTPLRDTERCRIVRVVPRDGHVSEPMPEGSADFFVMWLMSDNLFWRLTAQRLLVEGNHVEQVPKLLALTRMADPDLTEGFHLIHALHTIAQLEGFQSADTQDAPITLLRHPFRRVRRT
ncbi:MAG: ThuA domain-containing protein, partial [Planctomycetota bacterium]|nr:ThuA domain-containing protein [Planctomycetota bacterium]